MQWQIFAYLYYHTAAITVCCDSVANYKYSEGLTQIYYQVNNNDS